MITQETVINNVWPVVEQLIQATINEDSEAVAALLVPGEQAADMLEMFGVTVFDILLKTVLGRGGVSVTQVIETDNGSYPSEGVSSHPFKGVSSYPFKGVSRFLHIEYAWLKSDVADDNYTATDAVSIQFEQIQNQWKVVEINPASIALSLTSSRARQILASTQTLSEDDKVPAEPWILPIALYGGMLQLPIQPIAIEDEVEKHLLAGLQKRSYGATILINARRLWREFKVLEKLDLELVNVPAWVAAVEYIMSELNQRNQTQAAIGKLYKVNLSVMVPRKKKKKKGLKIKAQDKRYS